MISYNGVWLDLNDIERITAENSGLPYFGTKFAVMAVMKNRLFNGEHLLGDRPHLLPVLPKKGVFMRAEGRMFRKRTSNI